MSWRSVRRWLWRMIATLIILAAVLVGLARGLSPYLQAQHAHIAKMLSAHLHQEVAFQQVEATWHGLLPAVLFTHVVVKQQHKPWLQIGKVYVGIDWWRSLRLQKISIAKLWLTQLKLHIKRSKHRQWQVNGETFDLTQVTAKQSSLHLQQIILQHVQLALAWSPTQSVTVPDASLRYQLEQHQLKVLANNSVWEVPNVYAHAHRLRYLRVSALWHHHDNITILAVPSYHISDGNVSLLGSALLDKSTNAPWAIQLQSQLTVLAPAKITKSLPDKLMDTSLLAWLQQAIVQAAPIRGDVSWHGIIAQAPYQKGGGDLHISLPIRNMQLHYTKGWPAIEHLNAQLAFHNQHMSIVGKTASIAGCPIAQLSGHIDDYIKIGSMLRVQAIIPLALTQGVKILQHSPIKNTVGKNLARLSLKGRVRLGIDLQMNLHTDKVAVQGRVPLQGASIAAKATHIASLTKLQGLLRFDNHGIYADHMSGLFHGAPITISVATKDQRTPYTQIKFHTSLPSSTLLRLIDLTSWQQFFKGNINTSGRLNLEPVDSPAQSTLVLQSQLQGLQSLLRAPFNKTASAKRNLLAILSLPNDKPWYLRLRYQDVLHMALTPIKGSDTMAVNMAYGRDKALPIPTLAGTDLAVFSHKLQLPMWQAFFKQIKPVLKQGGASAPLYVHVRSDLFTYQHTVLHKLRINAKCIDQKWSGNIASKEVAGDVSWWPGKMFATLYARLRYVNWPRQKKHKQARQTQLKSPIKHWPALDIVCQRCQFGKLQLGKVILQATPFKTGGMRVSILKINNRNWSYTGNLSWHDGVKHTQTNITGVLASRNVARTLQALDIPLGLTGKSGRFTFDMAWRGVPWQVNMGSLAGEAYVAVDDGQITDVGQGAQSSISFGKLLNFLSLQSLSKRVLLDFSDIKARGFPFDSFKSAWHLKQGVATTNDALFTGNVAQVNLRGSVGFVKKDLNLRFSVRPHVTSSLPVIATIVGGPIAGVLAWVANKTILSPVAGHIAESHYTVFGSWRDPKVNKVSAKAAAH